MQAIRNELQHEMQVTQTLGTCLPIADFHAVSVSLPKWSDVVGYEEGKSEILHSLTSGYPRFRFHDAVYTLMEILRGIFPTLESIANAQDEAHSFLIGDYSHNPYNAQIEVDRRAGYLQWYIFPTKPIAARFSDFLHYDLNKKRISVDTNPAEKIQLYDMQASIKLFHIVNTPYVAVSFHDVLAVSAKRFWQHSGEILSSRQAVWLVEELQKKLFVVQYRDPATELITTKDSLVDLRTLQDKYSVQISFQDRNTPFLDEHFTKYDQGSITVGSSSSPVNAIYQRILQVVNAGEDGLINEDDMLITICGMAAIFTAYRLIQKAYKQMHPTVNYEVVVFGFPYLDTLKIMSRPEWNEGGVHFFGKANQLELEQLEQLLESKQLPTSNDHHVYKNQIAAIFIEFPTNPLMRCPNVQRLTELCNKYGVSLVADDTISSFANTNLFSSNGVCTDIVCSSLTKIFSGTGNVLGGSMILNPHSPRYEVLKETFRQLKTEHDLPTISDLDGAALEKNSRIFLWRTHMINKNALALATFLKSHPFVEHVHYPGLPGEPKDAYDKVIRSDFHPAIISSSSDQIESNITEQFEAGYGCLLSFELKDDVSTEKFYDSLQCNKGPSLGTNFTLACPYTLLAHYMELSWAEEYGVRSKLIRVSVGLEDIEDIITKFKDALEQSVM